MLRSHCIRNPADTLSVRASSQSPHKARHCCSAPAPTLLPSDLLPLSPRAPSLQSNTIPSLPCLMSPRLSTALRQNLNACSQSLLHVRPTTQFTPLHPMYPCSCPSWGFQLPRPRSTQVFLSRALGQGPLCLWFILILGSPAGGAGIQLGTSDSVGGPAGPPGVAQTVPAHPIFSAGQRPRKAGDPPPPREPPLPQPQYKDGTPENMQTQRPCQHQEKGLLCKEGLGSFLK